MDLEPMAPPVKLGQAEAPTRSEAARRAVEARRRNCEARLAELIRACLACGLEPAAADRCHRCLASLRAHRSISRGFGARCHHRYRDALEAAQLELFPASVDQGTAAKRAAAPSIERRAQNFKRRKEENDGRQ